MPSVQEITCLTPGCGRTLKVNYTERGNVSFFCKLDEDGCGLTVFISAKKGVAMWKSGPVTDPQQESQLKANPQPAKSKGFLFPFEEEN